MSAEINHAGRAHALLSASGASRWMRCTPSARLEEHYPEKSSKHADEGTLAHEFGELELRKIMKLISLEDYKTKIKELRADELYTSDMEDHVDVYVSKVMEQYHSEEGSELIIEERVDFTRYAPEGFGTCDALIGDFKNGILYVTDLKYGKGVQVFAKDNSQLKLYALGALNKYIQNDGENVFGTVIITIVQPRLNHIDSWEISVGDLLEWANGELKEKAELAFEGKGELCAGDHCRFCKAAARCSALSSYSLEAAKLDFADNDNPGSMLTDEELSDIYRKIPVISLWIGKVQEYMLEEALKGKKWQDLKLVEGRSNRVWQDSDKVQERLYANMYEESEFMTKKLAGIGVVEKLMGKPAFNEYLSDLVVKPQGKPSLVPTEDKRPEMGLQSAINDFSESLDE